jgi:phosphoesterase RecJ-like protein
MEINKIIKSIEDSRVIGITFHTSPDGDSLGSALGLLLALRKLNKKAYIISKEKLPLTFDFLPCSKEIDGNVSEALPLTDIVIALDCGNTDRLNWNCNIDDLNFKLLNLDHHLSNSHYGDINYVDSSKASVGEIIYALIKELQIPIDKDIAMCLYTSILTDTGGFRHSNTTKNTHSIASELVEFDIKFSDIYRIIYEDKKYSRVKLQGKVIEKLHLYHDNKICVMEVTKDMLGSVNEENSDTSDLISIGMSIDEVEIAVLFKEGDEGTKVSLRSKFDYDVRKLAELFGGGGHTKAAGLYLKKPIEEAKLIVLSTIEKGMI